jgi:IMP dehydrogenase
MGTRTPSILQNPTAGAGARTHAERSAGASQPDTAEERNLGEGLTFDDVLLVPAYSEVHPADTDVSTQLTRRIHLSLPLVSAAMDTVTESRMAIEMARAGGIGIIHKNMSIEAQAAEVDRVKRSESGMILNPITLTPERPLRDALRLMEQYSISGVPIVDGDGRLRGIITNRDLQFERELDRPVADVMTRDNLVTTPIGTSLEEAERILHRERIEKLPVVDEHGRLRGLITVKDIFKRRRYPNACKDEHGRLRAGAAIGTSEQDLSRATALIDAGCDVLVIDTAHGHSAGVLQALERARSRFPDVQIVAGNVGTAEAARALQERGADAVKVGIGPGSICTTRVVTGVGVPQFTAILEAVRGVEGSIPVIADGGIRYSGDIVKAIAAGASCVMMGSILAGSEESPGESFLLEGRRFKTVRGMGSLSAMEQGSADRYFQGDSTPNRKFVPEGIEARVPYKGPAGDVLYQLVGGLRSGMGYVGCENIGALKTRSRYMRITHGGLRESHPHDVTITREAPNYHM